MTLKKSFTTTGTEVLKTRRGVWKKLSRLGAGLAGIFVQGMKHASDADDDSGEDQPYGHEYADALVEASAHDFKDGWGP